MIQNEMENLKALLDGTPANKDLVDSVEVREYTDILEDEFAKSTEIAKRSYGNDPLVLVTRRNDLKKKIIKMIRRGRTKQEILHDLSGSTGCKYALLHRLINEAMADERNAYNEYVKDVAYYNIVVMREIIDECMQSGRYSTALAAIQEMNKIAHLSDTVTTIESAAPVKITFTS